VAIPSTASAHQLSLKKLVCLTNVADLVEILAHQYEFINNQFGQKQL
jgi:hypothetical protein